MAKPSEILATLREAGLPSQDSANVYALRSQLDTTKGITDALREKAFLDSFGDDVPVYLEDAEVEAPLPTFPTILSKLKIENDDKNMKGGRSAIEKFIEDFPKKRKAWKKAIEGDPAFGERGWEFFKDAWKQASNDKMRTDIEAERKKALEGDNLVEKAGMFLTKFFRPRAYEAWERGEDPTLKDQVGDFVESGLMAIPAGQYVGKASRILSKIPKAGQYAQKALANKAVGTVLGNAVAPFASEAMDAAMRGEDDPNTQRQDFSVGDALMGLATNLGVGFGLARFGGGAGRVATGELTRSGQGGVSGKARELVTNIGKSRAERGLPAPTTKWGKVLDVAEMGAPTLLVNRYGKDNDANLALNMMSGAFSLMPDTPNLAQEVKKMRDDEHKEAQDRKTKKEVEGVKASRILDLDARDVKYLDAVANDPSIVQFGYAPNNDDFKLWLLERGHKLLANTGAHRPIWEAK
jgi:hypothetical protein